MGYTIVIGDVTLLPEYGRFHVGVRAERLPNAPAFPGDPLSQHVNRRDPSYSGWVRFTEAVGLHDLFFKPAASPEDPSTGLMAEHPSVAMLTAAHRDRIRGALDRYRTQHPGAVPGWCMCARCEGLSRSAKPDVVHVELDGDLARLIWLEFWASWALEHCAHPALENS